MIKLPLFTVYTRTTRLSFTQEISLLYLSRGFCLFQEKGGIFGGMFKKPPKLSEAAKTDEVMQLKKDSNNARNIISAIQWFDNQSRLIFCF